MSGLMGEAQACVNHLGGFIQVAHVQGICRRQDTPDRKIENGILDQRQNNGELRDNQKSTESALPASEANRAYFKFLKR